MAQVWKKEGSSTFTDSYDVYSIEETVVNDCVVKKSVIKTVRPSEVFAGLKASDFALENVIAAGAVGMLKDAVLHDDSVDVADVVDNTVGGLMDAIDAAASAAASKNNDVEE